MKKVLVAATLCATLLQADPYTRKDRIEDMQIMAEAMNEISTGFFYNNKRQVIKGALKLSDTIRNVRPPLEEKEEKNPMVRYMNEKVKFSNKIVKKIDKKAADIIERFQEGDINEALQAYKKIMSACMECHAKIRQW